MYPLLNNIIQHFKHLIYFLVKFSLNKPHSAILPQKKPFFYNEKYQKRTFNLCVCSKEHYLWRTTQSRIGSSWSVKEWPGAIGVDYRRWTQECEPGTAGWVKCQTNVHLEAIVKIYRNMSHIDRNVTFYVSVGISIFFSERI